ncbi:metalloregulator ArsR/SmtB family transcription factor [Paraburkholderia bryophila]|uniref:ArsR/SmtB family transcription factor n=1 Tax=Paraburkholderia bryophila TaxID=420952 RepID=UPI00300DC3CB
MLVAVGSRGMPAGEISARLGMVRSSLSFHLKDMSQANLVSARREGTFIYYSAVLDTVHGVVDFLTENCLACPTGVSPSGEKAARSPVRTSDSAEGAVTKAVSS